MRSYIKKYMSNQKIQDLSGAFDDSIEFIEHDSVDDISLDDFIAETAIEAEGIDKEELGEENNIRKKVLTELVSTLETYELQELIEDILLEKEENLNSIFRFSRWATVNEQAFDWLLVQPYIIKKSIAEQFDSLFSKALSHKFLSKEDSSKVIERIISISVYNRFGLSESFIKDLVKHESLDKVLKLDILMVLSRYEEDNPDARFWENEIQIEEEPFLAPAVLSAFIKSDPLRGVDALTRIGENYKPSQLEIDYFNSYIEWTLDQLLRSRNLFKRQEFDQVRIKIRSPWIHELIESILERDGIDVPLPAFPAFEQENITIIKEGEVDLVREEFEGSVIVQFRDRIKSFKQGFFNSTQIKLRISNN